MKDSDIPLPSVGFLTKWTIVVALLLGLFGVLFTTVVLGFRPAFMQMERQAMRQSHQYTEAKTSLLFKLVEEYDTLAVSAFELEMAGGHDKLVEGIRSQQQSLLARIRVEVARLDPEAVPPHIKAFLEDHP